MPNSRTQWKRHVEVLERAAQGAGTDPLAVRIQRGALTFNLPGFGFHRAVIVPEAGVLGDNEPAPEWAGVQPADVGGAVFDLRHFSAAALYLDLVDGGAAALATITAYRVLDNGDVVQETTWAAVGHHRLVRDELVNGCQTYYRLTAIALDGASAITLRVAGEGLGYVE